MVALVKIKSNELHKAHRMHRKGFMPTFIKYHDKINPIFMPYSKFKRYYNNPWLTMFWIITDGIKVGQIWIKTNDISLEIARLFILNNYQNNGFAQTAIQLAEKIYSNYDDWQLDTIKQEKNNCHLYEKMGYMPTGEEKIINSKMTVINYRKSFK